MWERAQRRVGVAARKKEGGHAGDARGKSRGQCRREFGGVRGFDPPSKMYFLLLRGVAHIGNGGRPTIGKEKGA